MPKQRKKVSKKARTQKTPDNRDPNRPPGPASEFRWHHEFTWKDSKGGKHTTAAHWERMPPQSRPKHIKPAKPQPAPKPKEPEVADAEAGKLRKLAKKVAPKPVIVNEGVK
jgi:hypothetical protein